MTRDSACVQRRPLVGGERIGVGEEDDVVRPLPDQEGVLHCSRIRAEDAERLVANLPAVAVRAVQEIAPPPLADAGDVGQLVAEAGGDQDPPRVQDSAAREANREARLDPGDVILDQLDAVAGRFGPAGGQEFGRRHPVPRKETLHVSCRRVPRRSGIDDGDPAACAAEHERRTQAGRAAADHHHVKVVFVVFVHVSSLRVAARFSKVCCRFRESLITWGAWRTPQR